MQEKPPSSEKIFNLDNQANKLGMGGNYHRIAMRAHIKKECSKEKIFKPKDYKLEQQKKDY